MEAKPSPIAQELLSRAFSPETAESIFTERVRKRPLLLRPTINDVSDGREARRRARAESRASHAKALPKPKPLTAREIRASNIYKIPAEARKYEIYKPLHTLWQGYIQEVLGGASSLPINATTAGRLCSADFHGAEVEVVRSRCVGRVGLKGIVLKDTKFTFEIITSADIIKSMWSEVDGTRHRARDETLIC